MLLLLLSPDASISPDRSVASPSIWQLPTPSTPHTAAAADEQLQEKLLPLAVGLYRAGALGPTLQQYKANAGEEVKGAVREVVQQVLPVLLSACGDSLPQLWGSGGAGGGEGQAWEQLQVRQEDSRGAALLLVACLCPSFAYRQLTKREGSTQWKPGT